LRADAVFQSQFEECLAMKTSLKITVLLAALTVVSTARLSSAGLPDSSAKTSSINYADLYYDYEVWAGEPRFRWFVVWEFGDGSTYEQGTFLTEQEALNFVAKSYFGGYEPEGAVGFDLVEKEVEPVFEYITTYDKKSDAVSLANALENVGLYADVRRVSIFQYQYSMSR
jgi:hypothetical protein